MAGRSRRKAPTAEASNTGSGTGVIALEGALDLEDAAPLRAALLERRGGDLVVDVSAVRHLGALCAQVLLAASAAWAADGRSFDLRDPSAGFIQGRRLLGLANILTSKGTSA